MILELILIVAAMLLYAIYKDRQPPNMPPGEYLVQNLFPSCNLFPIPGLKMNPNPTNSYFHALGISGPAEIPFIGNMFLEKTCQVEDYRKQYGNVFT